MQQKKHKSDLKNSLNRQKTNKKSGMGIDWILRWIYQLSMHFEDTSG